MSSSAFPPERPQAQLSIVLECIECGARSDDGRGWKAYLYDGRDVCIYCSECAQREFGDG